MLLWHVSPTFTLLETKYIGHDDSNPQTLPPDVHVDVTLACFTHLPYPTYTMLESKRIGHGNSDPERQRPPQKCKKWSGIAQGTCQWAQDVELPIPMGCAWVSLINRGLHCQNVRHQRVRAAMSSQRPKEICAGGFNAVADRCGYCTYSLSLVWDTESFRC